MKYTNFYNRIEEIVEKYKLGSVNILARQILGYKSPEKLYILNRKDKNPSSEILNDFKNAFPEISYEWLVDGTGEMLIDPVKKENSNIVKFDKCPLISKEPGLKYEKALKDRIRFLERQIEKKDRQLEEMNKQITAILELLNNKSEEPFI
ncbi:MAG: hypothetical protein LBQ22_03655 [Bacteroidales bacterium]|jgi:hypothetical protein|nr:hypothetical protein [Bacteroidales bacterium]